MDRVGGGGEVGWRVSAFQGGNGGEGVLRGIVSMGRGAQRPWLEACAPLGGEGRCDWGLGSRGVVRCTRGERRAPRWGEGEVGERLLGMGGGFGEGVGR